MCNSSEAGYSLLSTQMAKRGVGFVVFIGLVQVTFAFKLFTSDAVRLVPVDFGFADASIAKLDEGNSLHLAPATVAIKFAETRQVTDGIADGNHSSLVISQMIEKDAIPLSPALIILCPRRLW